MIYVTGLYKYEYIVPFSYPMAGSFRTLENAWRVAAPKIASIVSSLSLHETPNRRVVRVGQLDAVLLDQELAQVLKEPVLKALSLVSVCSVLDILLYKVTGSFSIPLKLVLSRNSVYLYNFSSTNCRCGIMAEATVQNCRISDISRLKLSIDLSLVRIHFRLSSVTLPSCQHPGCHA